MVLHDAVTDRNFAPTGKIFCLMIPALHCVSGLVRIGAAFKLHKNSLQVLTRLAIPMLMLILLLLIVMTSPVMIKIIIIKPALDKMW